MQNNTTNKGAAPPRNSAVADADSRRPIIDSASLFQGGRELYIVHGGCIYTLRLTRGDKLILTK